jgi:hypothetical protein
MIDLNSNELRQISGGKAVAPTIILIGPIIASLLLEAIGLGNQQNK